MVKDSFKDFMDDECPRMAAALSYYTVFALPPLLILLLLIAGAVFDPAEVQNAIQTQMGSLMGASGAQEIGTIINQAERPGGRGLKAVLGVGALILGATGAFLQLQAALNRAWEVEPDPKQGGFKNFVFKRLLSLGMILGIAFLLLVSLALSAAVSAIGGVAGRLIPGASSAILFLFDTVITFAVVAGLFAAIFKVLPDARIAWKDVCVGALVTARALHRRQVRAGVLPGQQQPGRGVRRGGVAGPGAGVDLLLVHDRALRRGVHAAVGREPRRRHRAGDGRAAHGGRGGRSRQGGRRRWPVHQGGRGGGRASKPDAEESDPEEVADAAAEAAARAQDAATRGTA